jgi:hypothetical protein
MKTLANVFAAVGLLVLGYWASSLQVLGCTKPVRRGALPANG